MHSGVRRPHTPVGRFRVGPGLAPARDAERNASCPDRRRSILPGQPFEYIIVIDRLVAASFSWYDLLAQAIPVRYLTMAGLGLLGLIAVVLVLATTCYFSRGN